MNFCHQLAILFFFFQAEDGIRDLTVTGVQTCALPIWWRVHVGRQLPRVPPHALAQRPRRRLVRRGDVRPRRRDRAVLVPRSEERRVGKECRSRWLWYLYK